MSYTIYPRIKYLYDCKSLVVYNDIYNNKAVSETGTLSALSFRLRRYNQSDYMTEAITVSAPATTITWGTITAENLGSYRYYPTLSSSSPGASTTYTLTLTLSDASTLAPTFTSSSSTWQQVFEGLISSAEALGSGYISSSYDTQLNSLFISDGTKTISSIVITSDNSDTSIEIPATTSSSTFVEDVYSIEVEATVDGDDITRTYYIPIYCTTYQCILRLISSIPALYECNTCNTDCIRKIVSASGLMDSLNYKEISNAEDISEAQQVIADLQNICSNENCDCNG